MALRSAARGGNRRIVGYAAAVNKPTLTPARIRRALERRFGALSDPRPIAEGEESQAFALDIGGEPHVLRVNRSSAGFEKDAFVQRFACPGLPIPGVVAIGAVDDGHAYCVTRRVPGVTLQDLAPAALPAVVAPVAAVMAEIAAGDLSGTGGYGPFDSEGAGRHACWRDFLTAIADPAQCDWRAAAGRADIGRVRHHLDLVVTLAADCPEIRQLVHGDFGSNNVLTEGGRITGVIDWSEALFGDPLYDVANILFWRPWLACMEAQARYFERHRADWLHPAARLICYQLRIGLGVVHEAALAGHDDDLAWAAARCEAIAGM